jgi:hypothetical protein
VGIGEEQGCRLLLTALDKMGNAVSESGAAVTCGSLGAGKEHIQTSVVDNKDGTYALSWRGKVRAAHLSLLLDPADVWRWCVTCGADVWRWRVALTCGADVWH